MEVLKTPWSNTSLRTHIMRLMPCWGSFHSTTAFHRWNLTGQNEQLEDIDVLTAAAKSLLTATSSGTNLNHSAEKQWLSTTQAKVNPMVGDSWQKARAKFCVNQYKRLQSHLRMLLQLQLSFRASDFRPTKTTCGHGIVLMHVVHRTDDLLHEDCCHNLAYSFDGSEWGSKTRIYVKVDMEA